MIVYSFFLSRLSPMRRCVCLLILVLIPTASGLFWDVLNCLPLPRIEWGSPYYYQQPAPVETPVITQQVQPVQQIQYVYKQPIVKYLQPVKYVYLQNGAQAGGGYPVTANNGNGYNSGQTPRPPYKLSQEYLAKRGYSTGPRSSYAIGRLSSPDPSDNIQSAPYAHKLTSISGKSEKNGKKNKTEKKQPPTTTTEIPEDELVELDDEEEPGKMTSPVDDINKRKKTFHIHEDVGGKSFLSPKGKSSSMPVDEEEEDLDILTTDDHMKPSEENLEGGGKPAEEKEMVGIEPETSTETVQSEENTSKEMIGVIPGEFMTIGKDTKSSKITKMEPATAPPNLKEGHEDSTDSFEEEMEELEEGN